MYYEDLFTGPKIKPISMVYLYNDKEWEEFIAEWASVKESDYKEVEVFGGSGDKGRDVIAYINKDKPLYKWDCYQCKFYTKPLSPSDAWVEFGKIIYYTFKKDYPIPEKYFFVAPRGLGPKLTDLLNQVFSAQEKLRATIVSELDQSQQKDQQTEQRNKNKQNMFHSIQRYYDKIPSHVQFNHQTVLHM
jgi:hypothetical protein